MPKNIDLVSNLTQISKKTHEKIKIFIEKNFLFKQCTLRHITHYNPISVSVDSEYEFTSEYNGRIKEIHSKIIMIDGLTRTHLKNIINIKKLKMMGKLVHISDLSLNNFENIDVYLSSSKDIPKFPDSLKKLKIDFHKCNHDKLKIRSLNLKKLTIAGNHSVKNVYIPENVTHLTLNINPLQIFLPLKLTHLIFGDIFDEDIPVLPETLSYLKIGNKYDKSLPNLPHSIIELDLGESFNQNIFENLPRNLKKLSLGMVFNHKLQNIPKSLEYLRIGTIERDYLYRNSFEYISVYEHDIICLPENLKLAILPKKIITNLKTSNASKTTFHIIYPKKFEKESKLIESNDTKSLDENFRTIYTSSYEIVHSSYFF
ncbi:hypothetical protein EON71_00510 [bacterium]|nr:MAG: hypothetical protein EON71_00510 [bacterium]